MSSINDEIKEPTYALDRFFHNIGLGFPDSQTLINRAIAASKAHDWKLASGLYGRLCSRHPNVANYWLRLAAVRNVGGQPALAAKAAQRSIALDPTVDRSHVTLGYALEHLGDFKGALSTFEQALAILPDEADAQAERLVLLAHENPEQALVSSDRLHSLDPSDSRHQLRLALIAKRAGLMEAELTIYERARDIAAGNGKWDVATEAAAQVWVIHAKKRDHYAQLEAGRRMLELARKREPGDHRLSLRKVLLMHGLALAASEPHAAVAVLDEARAIKPIDERDRLDELSRRLIALENLGSIEEERRVATEMVETGRAIGDKQHELQGMRHLAYCLLADDDGEGANRQIDEVLARYQTGDWPSEATSLSSAAYVAWLSGDARKAKERIADALAKSDSSGEIVADAIGNEADMILGSLALDRGDHGEAETRLVRAVDKIRKSFPAGAGMRIAELARLRVAQNRLQEARELIEEARMTAQRPEAIKLVVRAERALEAADRGSAGEKG